MTEAALQHKVLDRVAEDRRTFVRELLASASFEAPDVASFSMGNLSSITIEAMGLNGGREVRI